ncbi:MAG TPA: hypothetical protein VF831_04670, partial [Anaerolineales bacterium]
MGEAERVILADKDLGIAERAVRRVNQLLDKNISVGMQVDVTDMAAVEHVLAGVDAFVSAV